MTNHRKDARSSEETSQETTAVALSRTDSSITSTSESDGAVACRRGTRTDGTSSERERDARLDLVLQVIGGALSRQFVSSDCVWLLLMDLKKLGFEREAELLAKGFSNNRTSGVHNFMG